ncbi:hypothetical protein [Methylosinus sp. Sm6]|uniref:hypothetical protein n=1 Tax=Methylosinus sp. Sm6 TaxID=2866948 RepID=UPI001C99D9B6|nr:hypothetical protein [Methylosinus sp. Sm6]MBY6239922.1 hypothetical protein [Methylosinus sp. Sm6]
MPQTTFATDDLRAALEAGVIDASTHHNLEAFLAERASGRESAPRFDVVNVLWYMGALIVISAMSLFSTTAFGLWGAPSLIVTSLAYGLAFTAAGAYLWRRRGLRTPAGLLVTCAVAMAPLLVFALQLAGGHDPTEAPNYHDFYVWVRSSWLPMELGTMAAALIALIFFPFPFLTMIIAFALWFMSMDVTPWLLRSEAFSFEQRANVSLVFGLVVMAAAWLIDLKRWRGGDFAFWLHLSGLLAFWGGLTAQHSGDEIGKALYCLINFGLVTLSLVLMRRAYAVFGAFGLSLYLGHLASEVFQDSILFPFALSAIGVAIIATGLLFHRYGARLAGAIGAALPDQLRDLRPAHARDARE